ncbi:unnamed protein product [Acanthoscelides obtectus]|uniref:Uncharacterized protein n=1 Tax=Acanthoscelides obtectus TaxID=200917 RepID=A0A9P0L2E4_ACAOB|nr:unnamed protein product [Acanthoscelides obtectus]CAK1633041.1 hypothetical protein AOBTE_LOCUS7897 [Acanthoscelides obtectus]
MVLHHGKWKKTNLVFNKQKNECYEKLAWPQNWPTTKRQNNQNLKTSGYLFLELLHLMKKF